MNRIHGIITSLILCCGAAAQAQNLITNPGFESGGTGWTLFTQSGSVAVASVSYPSTGAHGGTRYAQVNVTTPAASSSENWHIQFQPPTGWSASVGWTYEIKFWAKVDTAANIHVSVQGSDYTYITGTTIGLTPDWTEYSYRYVADAEGANAVRFHIYVAETKGIYSFDDFSITGTAPAGVSPGMGHSARGLQVRQESNRLVLSMGPGATGMGKAELMDLRGTRIHAVAGAANKPLNLLLPRQSGIYFVRAQTATQEWVRKVVVP